MKSKITSTDFEEIEDHLTEIQRRIADFQLGKTVDLNEFFSPSFMQEHTTFESFEGFREECPRDPETGEELAAIPDRELDSYVKETTEFQSWQTMQNQAAQEDILSQLTF